MCRAVTLSRSPPRADTTMMATGDRSRIWRQSSKPSASGSIRSSSTMSGSSVSSSCSARIPSTLTTVSKPRTARLDLIRSTMLGSSSTTRAQVLRAASVIAVAIICRPPGPELRGGREIRWTSYRAGAGHLDAVEDLGLDGQVHAEARALAQRGQLDPAAMRLHDALRDGQAEAGARVLAVAAVTCVVTIAAEAGFAHGTRAESAGWLERCGDQLGRHPLAVVLHADDYLRGGRFGRGRDVCPGS